MRLAMRISPSRVSSSTVPISRMYMRTGSVVRPSSASSAASAAAASSIASSSAGATGSVGEQRLGVRCLLVHRNAHVVDRVDDVFDLLRIDDLGGQVIVDLRVGEVALLLAARDQQLQLRLALVGHRRHAALDAAAGACRRRPCRLDTRRVGIAAALRVRYRGAARPARRLLGHAATTLPRCLVAQARDRSGAPSRWRAGLGAAWRRACAAGRFLWAVCGFCLRVMDVAAARRAIPPMCCPAAGSSRGSRQSAQFYERSPNRQIDLSLRGRRGCAV